MELKNLKARDFDAERAESLRVFLQQGPDCPDFGEWQAWLEPWLVLEGDALLWQKFGLGPWRERLEAWAWLRDAKTLLEPGQAVRRALAWHNLLALLPDYIDFFSLPGRRMALLEVLRQGELCRLLQGDNCLAELRRLMQFLLVVGGLSAMEAARYQSNWAAEQGDWEQAYLQGVLLPKSLFDKELYDRHRLQLARYALRCEDPSPALPLLRELSQSQALWHEVYVGLAEWHRLAGDEELAKLHWEIAHGLSLQLGEGQGSVEVALERARLLWHFARKGEEVQEILHALLRRADLQAPWLRSEAWALLGAVEAEHFRNEQAAWQARIAALDVQPLRRDLLRLLLTAPNPNWAELQAKAQIYFEQQPWDLDLFLLYVELDFQLHQNLEKQVESLCTALSWDPHHAPALLALQQIATREGWQETRLLKTEEAQMRRFQARFGAPKGLFLYVEEAWAEVEIPLMPSAHDEDEDEDEDEDLEEGGAAPSDDSENHYF